MGKRSAARTAGSVTGTALSTGGGAAGTAAQRAGEALQRAGAVVGERSVTAAPEVEAAVGAGVERAADVLESAVEGTVHRVGEVVGAVGDVLTGLLEEPAVRSGAALEALRGRAVTTPVGLRPWRWAAGAAAVGAAAGALVALLVHRFGHPDAPDAQEPHELRAVVDSPGPNSSFDQSAQPGVATSVEPEAETSLAQGPQQAGEGAVPPVRDEAAGDPLAAPTAADSGERP